ncbi:MAG: hypothetical protein ABIH11_01480 [Candidatus Altiarchaeota archaeon]
MRTFMPHEERDGVAAPSRFSRFMAGIPLMGVLQRRLLENADCVVDDYDFKIAPKGGGYHYSVYNPHLLWRQSRDPSSVPGIEPATIVKEGVSDEPLYLDGREEQVVRETAVKHIEREVRGLSRGGVLDWLGGIPLEEWKRVLDKHTYDILHVNITSNLGSTDRGRMLLGKYGGAGIRDFLSEEPAREIFHDMGDVSENTARQQQNVAGAMMLAFIRQRAFKDFGFEHNCLTNAFFFEALERLRRG